MLIVRCRITDIHRQFWHSNNYISLYCSNIGQLEPNLKSFKKLWSQEHCNCKISIRSRRHVSIGPASSLLIRVICSWLYTLNRFLRPWGTGKLDAQNFQLVEVLHYHQISIVMRMDITCMRDFPPKIKRYLR